jgi:cellulose biosynthesis protein BcsQ
MGLIQSYGIWNNKGGVGKSTITFHLAARYAEKFPKKKVLVIDLCPQANSSMMLLGGGVEGEKNVLDLCTSSTPRTVVGYLGSVIAAGAGAPLPNPNEFMVRVSDKNSSLPANLNLLCGDGNLEPMAPAISGASNAPALTPTSQPWVWVHQVFRRYIESVCETYPNDSWLVIVDTNPSFGIYTEIAVSAVNRLIIPVNADDSSRTAANALFILLHGMNPPHPIYGSWTFAAQASKHGITVPQIHLVVGNRLTQYSGSAAAFGAMSDATSNALHAQFMQHPAYFTERAGKVESLAEFIREYSSPLRDFNTAGVVAAHIGALLSELRNGYYQVHGASVQVNTARVNECSEALDQILARL